MATGEEPSRRTDAGADRRASVADFFSRWEMEVQPESLQKRYRKVITQLRRPTSEDALAIASLIE
ncbi:MAG: hypothetical protein DWH91_19230 [Planctomycetota bacterium]|nr:MAG: hypothetical protein DWH91_19230 [Planctomycetota bacterium]